MTYFIPIYYSSGGCLGKTVCEQITNTTVECRCVESPELIVTVVAIIVVLLVICYILARWC